MSSRSSTAKRRPRAPGAPIDPVRQQAGRKAWANRLARGNPVQMEAKRWLARVATGSYLGQERAEEIRARHAAGEPMKSLALVYGVSVATVWRAVRGKLWAPLSTRSRS